MKSRRHPDFREAYARLPKEVRAQAKRAYDLFKQDPYHNSLYFKQVDPVDPVFSVRIGRSYRALGIKRGDAIIWFWIGHHSEYDKILSQL